MSQEQDRPRKAGQQDHTQGQKQRKAYVKARLTDNGPLARQLAMVKSRPEEP